MDSYTSRDSDTNSCAQEQAGTRLLRTENNTSSRDSGSEDGELSLESESDSDSSGSSGQSSEDEEADLLVQDELRREREELLAELELLKQGTMCHSNPGPVAIVNSMETKTLSRKERTAQSADEGAEESNKTGNTTNDDGEEDEEEPNLDCLERFFAETLSISKENKEWWSRPVRVSLQLIYFFILANLHFLFLPSSYVRHSMVNSFGSGKASNFGEHAMRHFFRANGHVGVLPRPRVIYILVLGCVLAVTVFMGTHDEFLFGLDDGGGACINGTNAYPVAISFRDVGCRVHGVNHPILSHVTGQIRPGQLTGVLGASGAGKSTFAMLLLGRGSKVCSHPLGSIFLNGEERSLNAILDRVGFVPQRDDLYEDLTVAEALMFSASWRLPRHYNDSQREKALEETLELLDLAHIRNERIGGLISRGISGGEKKRVSIGIELITNPSVLVMDEPTSGLDGAAAFKLMNKIRNIVDQKGVSVVTVLHVPSTRVYKLLDNIILLQHGEAVYVGPRQDAFPTFVAMGFDAKNQFKSVTEPEFLLDITAGVIQYPDSMCPYAKMVETKYGAFSDKCEGDPTLPMKWRQVAKKFLLREPPRRTSQLDDICAGDSCGPILKIGARVQTAVDQMLREADTAKAYPRVSKPGLAVQVMYWFRMLVHITWRKGVFLEIGSSVLTASFCAWVRSYSGGWDSRAMASFFVSITVAAAGAFSAVFQDDILPVKRFAASGMVLGAHHNATMALNILRAIAIAFLFSLTFHLTLWVRVNDCNIWRIRRVLEMTYIIMMYFLVNWAGAAFICVLTLHDFESSCIVTIGVLLGGHVFAMYSPNSRQISLDSLILDKYNLSTAIRWCCAMSPARYFIEAFTVWDSEPDPNHPNLADHLSGRKFMLNYFGYREENLSSCLSTLFSLIFSLVCARWYIFGYVNSTHFHWLYVTPLFAKFFIKLHMSLAIAQSILMTLNEEVGVRN
eukprot:CAMPEP_0203787104 /NCGR_PEP_ID=MMETSP0100_2-20121128/2026_1 /ASSEMBLY_ACC=CAM_ASM_000210 /TAXON_ID=96639 /ORGANISM=" , Strain NY0313808BC1" /LENGTH=962 /DNA_ID=CAMNT_0050689539 /DNA_START=648 /DNA_END=3536 /DNA_ORIENTATION=-